MPDLVDLSEAIKSLRGARTQKAVALRGPLSPSTWNRYEKCRVRKWPGGKTFSQLATGLGCTPQRLEMAIMEATQKRYASNSAGSDGGEIAEYAARYGADDPLRRAAYDHFHRIADEVLELYLLAIQPHPQA